jgi:hypothetical protein
MTDITSTTAASTTDIESARVEALTKYIAKEISGSFNTSCCRPGVSHWADYNSRLANTYAKRYYADGNTNPTPIISVESADNAYRTAVKHEITIQNAERKGIDMISTGWRSKASCRLVEKLYKVQCPRCGTDLGE